MKAPPASDELHAIHHALFVGVDFAGEPEVLAAWVTLAERFPESAALAVRAGAALRLAGNGGEALRYLERAFTLEPALWHAFADEELLADARQHGVAPVFEVASLAARLRSAALQGVSEEEEEELRDRYSSLLEEFADRDDILGALREIGATLRSLTESGELGQAFIRRPPRPR